MLCSPAVAAAAAAATATAAGDIDGSSRDWSRGRALAADAAGAAAVLGVADAGAVMAAMTLGGNVERRDGGVGTGWRKE